MTTLEDAAAQWREWFERGEFEAGAVRVEQALASDDTRSVDRVRALYCAHLFAFRLGRPSGAYCDEALALARDLGDVRGHCDALTGPAPEALRAGD